MIETAEALAARMRAVQAATVTLDRDISTAIGAEMQARDALQAALVQSALDPSCVPAEAVAREEYERRALATSELRARQKALSTATADLHTAWQAAIQAERSSEHQLLDRHLRAHLPDLLRRLTDDLALLRLLAVASGGSTGTLDWNRILHQHKVTQDIIGRRAAELRNEILTANPITKDV